MACVAVVVEVGGFDGLRRFGEVERCWEVALFYYLQAGVDYDGWVERDWELYSL